MLINKLIKFIFIFIFCSNSQGQQATIVNVDLVKKQKIEQTVPIIGSIVAKKNTNIMAPVSGRVDSVFIEEGDLVDKGRILANIDSENYKFHYEIAKADYEKSQALYEISKLETASNTLDLNRMKALKNSSSFNKSKYDKIENQNLILRSKEKTALYDLNIKKNLLNIAKLNLQKSSIRALYKGIIEEKFIEAGEVVNVGSKMFQLINKEKIEVFAEIPSNKIHNLLKGDKIAFTTTDNISLSGIVRSIGKRENVKTRTAKVYLDFSYKIDFTKRELLSGESVNMFIPISKGNKQLTIHKDAILKREGISLAYVVKKSKVEIRPLKLGLAVGNRFIVLDGVFENEKAVIKGNERLRPGQEVNIINKK